MTADKTVKSRKESFDDITVVVVLYNSQEVVENSLAGFSKNQKIIAIDNACSDESVSVVTRLHPQATIIRNAENRGYGPAVNQGLAMADTPYVLLISPDTVMKSGAIEVLHKYAEENRNSGIVAPYLFVPNKGLDLTVMGPGEFKHQAAPVMPEGAFCTWFASGAVWLMRVEAWQEIDGFDEKIFLYAEDLDYCLRLTKADKSILICPDAEGEHLLSRSAPFSEQIQWRKEWNIVWGHLYVTQKHQGVAKMRAEIVRLLFRHLPKMIFYKLVLDRKRFRRDFAVVHATISFVLGGKPER